MNSSTQNQQANRINIKSGISCWSKVCKSQQSKSELQNIENQQGDEFNWLMYSDKFQPFLSYNLNEQEIRSNIVDNHNSILQQKPKQTTLNEMNKIGQRKHISTEKDELKMNSFDCDELFIHKIENKVICWPEHSPTEQANKSPQTQKIKKKLKKELNQSNSIKNFANNFVKQLKDPSKFNDLKVIYGIEQNFKNILDNINKKIRYEKRSQKKQQLESMINHKNVKYRNFLVAACQRYLQWYPYIVDSSKKIKHKEGNKEIIPTIEAAIRKVKENL